MRKAIFLFSSLFIFFLFFAFWSNGVYAQTCQLSMDQKIFPPDFKGRITINGTGCFMSGIEYTILGYPAYVFPDKYFNYYVGQRERTSDPNSITAQFDLTQPNREQQSRYIFSGIGEDNPGSWIIKVCVAKSIADCGNKDNIVGNVIPITVSAVPTPTPTPIPSNLPKVYIIPTQCTFKIGSEVEVTVDKVQPNTDYQWWWKEGLFPTSHTIRPKGSDTFIKFSVPGSEIVLPGTRILCADIAIAGLKRCGSYSQNSVKLKFTIEPPPLDSSACVTTSTGAQTAQNIPTPTPIAPPPPCSEWTDLSGTLIPTGDERIQNPDYSKKCASVSTGLGIDIKTNPVDLVKSVFGIILSLSGGIALILIIMSGYQLIFSQGNPEQVKAAQEQLTSAIVGLLFIIFSLVILQIIGADILKIPGFKP